MLNIFLTEGGAILDMAEHPLKRTLTFLHLLHKVLLSWWPALPRFDETLKCWVQWSLHVIG